MIIKDAQAGLMLKESIVKKVSIKNDIVKHPGYDSEKSELDIDYDIAGVREHESGFVGILELKVKYHIKQDRKKIFALDLEMTGLLAAPKTVYDSEDKFKEAMEINGLTSLISIARATIASLTSHLFSEGCVKLPLINVFKVIRQKEIQDAPRP